MKPLLGGIEGGGTKFVCAVGTGPEDIQGEVRFPTAGAEETIGRAIEFFRGFKELAAIGVACFGPLDPDPGSPTYGHILPTPKPGWSNADVVGQLRGRFNLPVGFDTDVNGAVLGEARWGAARGCDPALYLTIGTGIGGGLLVNGSPLHGLLHPEMGHILLPHDRERDPYAGWCPFHGDCFEGLAAGPAIEKRWGQKAETLPPDHPAWDLEAEYIALALATFICTLSPRKIILGGGVAQQTHLLGRIHARVQALLNGYVQSPRVTSEIESYIVLPALGQRAGVLGAFVLAEQALEAAGQPGME